MGLAGNWETWSLDLPSEPFHGNFVPAGGDIRVITVAMQAAVSYIQSCRTRASAESAYSAASAKNGLYCLFSSIGVLWEPVAEGERDGVTLQKAGVRF